MSNTAVYSYGQEVWSYVRYSCDVWESGRKRAVQLVGEKLGAVDIAIANRVSLSVSEIFIDLCALTGILVVPAVIVFAAKRLYPLGSMLSEVLKNNPSGSTVREKWKEAKGVYARTFVETVTPGLLVAFAVDAIFCGIIGVVGLNAFCLLRAGAVSLPIALLLYTFLYHHCEKEQKEQPLPTEPPAVSPPVSEKTATPPPASLYPTDAIDETR